MINVIEPGLHATLQDLGRVGYTDIGVGRSGAADLASHRLANRLLGNDDRAATIEITFGGFSFRLTAAATISLTGARCPIRDSPTMDWNRAHSLPAGAVVTLGVPAAGLRTYLAVRGGLAAEEVLGSRSTDTLSGLGPQVLEAGTTLAIGTLISGDPAADPVVVTAAEHAGPRRLLVFPGPRLDWFTAEAWQRLLSSPWTMQADSNRIGYRLSGVLLTRSRAGELPSEATLPGAVQVPPDGQPIVLGPDAPVTGGYPVLGVVPRAELDQLAQCRPGDVIRFQEKRKRTEG
ncbi:5-oxoprolinase subunit C family protein [Jatrophihabitans sp. DSM 45814]